MSLGWLRPAPTPIAAVVVFVAPGWRMRRGRSGRQFQILILDAGLASRSDQTPGLGFNPIHTCGSKISVFTYDKCLVDTYLHNAANAPASVRPLRILLDRDLMTWTCVSFSRGWVLAEQEEHQE
jgi:hypothetical protein